MLRDLRLATVAVLAAAGAALDIAQATLQARRLGADPMPMSKPNALQQFTAHAATELRCGALVKIAGQFVEVLHFDATVGANALEALRVADDQPVTFALGQVLRGYTVIQHAPHITIPNALSDADLELLRTRVDQRGT